jgi:predicted GH43/DUF377 family glycosyl hydrolase
MTPSLGLIHGPILTEKPCGGKFTNLLEAERHVKTSRHNDPEVAMKRCFTLLTVVFALFACSFQAPPAFPPELTSFVPLTEKPLFAGAPGQWDAFIRERGWIVIEKGVWKLYYTGYDSPDGIRRLGLATSPDGQTWTRHPNNPLVKNEWIEDMMIVQDGEVSHLFAEGKDDQAHWFSSHDGLVWKRRGPLDVRLKNGDPIPPGPYGTPTVIKDNGVWNLFYERNDKGIWLARSKTLEKWINVNDEPVIRPGPGEYDHDMIAMNQVIKHKGRFYAYYHGAKNDADKSRRRWCTCLAVSDDLIHWDKYPKNPLLPLADNKSSGIVVPFEGAFRLYTMHPAVWGHSLSLPRP